MDRGNLTQPILPRFAKARPIGPLNPEIKRKRIMDKTSLMRFMKRILESGSEKKSAAALNQLLEILKNQNAPMEMIRLVGETVESLPEAKSASKQGSFSEESLKIAIERANNRKRWEAEMANRGRC